MVQHRLKQSLRLVCRSVSRPRRIHSNHILITPLVTYITPKGTRSTAEGAYLTPEVLARPNLKVATGARVTRVLFDKSSGTPRAVGVEFTNKTGQTFVAKALKEVVMRWVQIGQHIFCWHTWLTVRTALVLSTLPIFSCYRAWALLLI